MSTIHPSAGVPASAGHGTARCPRPAEAGTPDVGFRHRPGRVLLPVLVALVIPAAVTWLVWSVTHLVGSATSYHVRVTNRPPGVPMPTTAVVQQLLLEQNRWGDSVMFAVAAVAAALVLTLVAWLLGSQRKTASRAGVANGEIEP